jgi:hypothetical protein
VVEQVLAAVLVQLKELPGTERLILVAVVVHHLVVVMATVVQVL